jgi:peptide/nickel transport system permease protein
VTSSAGFPVGTASPHRRNRTRPVARFVVRRVVLGGAVLLAVSIVVFAATQALPGDAAIARLGRNSTPAALDAFRAHFHLDEPIGTQYLLWLGEILRGHLGTSLATSEPVSTLIHQRGANTLALLLCASVMGIPVALMLGIVAAIRRDGVFDHVTTVVLLVLAAVPEFVLGIGLIVLFATNLFHVFPPASLLDPQHSIWSQVKFVVLPAVVLALVITPYIARMIRASMVEVLESEYVAMARLKGLAERRVILRHAVVNAAPPTIQAVALTFGYLAGGVVVVETVFQYPGVGLALVGAIENRDLPVIQALVLLIAFVYTLVNIAADLLTTVVSPRLRTALK